MGVEGKVVLVTGASRGIGAATALWLAQRGAKVVAASRNAERLREVAAKADGASGSLAPVTVDVRKAEDVESAMRVAEERFGGLDAIVNNAAVGALGRVEDQSESDWREVFDTNVIGALVCCRAAIPRLAKRGGGTIVNVSSAAAGDGFPLLAAYSASKAAIAALSESLRRELKDRRIRISTLRIHHVASEFLSVYPAEQIGAAFAAWKAEGLVGDGPAMSPDRVAAVVEMLIGLPADASVHDVDVRPLGA